MFKRHGTPTKAVILQKCPDCGNLASLTPVKVGSTFKNLCKECKAKYENK